MYKPNFGSLIGEYPKFSKIVTISFLSILAAITIFLTKNKHEPNISYIGDCEDLGSQPTCIAVPGCSWTGGTTIQCSTHSYNNCPSSCIKTNPVSKSCHAFDDNKTACNDTVGCSYDEETKCEEETQTVQCKFGDCWHLGCSYTPAIVGKCDCSSAFKSELICEANGCSWDSNYYVAPTCSGNYQKTVSVCEDEEVCNGTYLEGGSCAGTYQIGGSCTGSPKQNPSPPPSNNPSPQPSLQPPPKIESCGINSDKERQERCVVSSWSKNGQPLQGSTVCSYENPNNGVIRLLSCCLSEPSTQYTHSSGVCCSPENVVWRYNPGLPNEPCKRACDQNKNVSNKEECYAQCESYCESYCIGVDSDIPPASDPVFGACIKTDLN